MPGSPAEQSGARRRASAAGRPAPAPAVRATAGGAAARRALAALGLAALAVPVGGCYAPEMLRLRSGLDSLRTQVDTLVVRDSIAYAVLGEIRRELVGQRDLLLSTRASSGSSTQDIFGQMGRLESKLDEVMGRVQQVAQRPTPPGQPSGPDPNQMYEEAAQDLTQGRYSMALRGFRDFVQRFPSSDLADNAQYGAGECFYAQAMFDSAATEYAQVGTDYPAGDRVPAALYKLALSQEKLKKTADARQTLNDLVKRYPLSGEAQLARDRLGARKR